MTFGFGQLIAHAAKTRHLAVGTIIGSGTVSNKQDSLWGSSVEHGGVGCCCLAELRMYKGRLKANSKRRLCKMVMWYGLKCLMKQVKVFLAQLKIP